MRVRVGARLVEGGEGRRLHHIGYVRVALDLVGVRARVRVRARVCAAHEALVDHLVEDGHHAVDGDGGEGKAEDAVELGHEEGDARLGRRLGEGRVGHLDAAWRESEARPR